MNKLKRISIETFVILLATLVLDIQAGCTWDKSSETSCTIECTADYDFSGTETLEEVLADLEIKWEMRQNCYAEGISLTLSSSLVYPNYVVKANWFTAEVKVKELKIYTSNVRTFEANAFNSTAFKSVKTLTFPSMSLDLINKGIFNGLESLEVLVMDSASLKTIEDGVLDNLSGTLKKIILIESSKYRSELQIDGLTGSQPMTELEEVKFNYNLKTTITHRSFVGLQNVKILDLSNCQIVTIGTGAFDPISSSIRELNLKDNAITTLPDGLFNSMLPNEVTTILLEGNKWDCECHLMSFKMTLMEHSNFVGSIKCNTPTSRRDLHVINTNFCDSYDPPSTQPTTQSTTTTTTTISTTTITDNSSPTVPSIPEEYSQKCYEPGESESSKIISIKTPSARLKVNENEYGEVLVEVETLSENFVLLWFSELDQETYYTASDEIACVIGSTNFVPINNLKPDTAYTFCLMNSTEKTVSPLDCRSYTRQHNLEQPWLLNSNKSFIISMTAVACSISLLIGLALGAFVLKVNHILKANGIDNHNGRNAACINEVLKETFQSNSIMRQQNRMSNMTADSFSTKRTTNLTIDYYFDHSDKAPPLPARPYSMDPIDEPIYAVVDNVRDK